MKKVKKERYTRRREGPYEEKKNQLKDSGEEALERGALLPKRSKKKEGQEGEDSGPRTTASSFSGKKKGGTRKQAR